MVLVDLSMFDFADDAFCSTVMKLNHILRIILNQTAGGWGEFLGNEETAKARP